MLAGMLITVVFVLARQGVGDPDIWWHLRNAEYLFKTGGLPRFDMYSFTAAGHPWINHEWLAEVPYYLAWRHFGLQGIQGLLIVLLDVIFLGLFYLCVKISGHLKASVLVCFLAILLGRVSFGPRTLLFGYIYLLALLIVLERFRAQGRGPLWVLPVLFCVWVNTHGSWSLGLIVFGINIASGFWAGKWGLIEASRWSPSQLRNLITTMSASIAALFINPFGYHLVLYPLDLAFRQKLNVAHVAEWVSVDFHDVRGKIVFLLVVALLLAALTNRCRWKLHEVGLVLFGLYVGLTYIRFIFFLGILVAPLLARFLRSVPPYQPETNKPVLNALFMAGMLAVMVRWFPSAGELDRGVSHDYPAEMLPYLKAHPPAGAVLNDYLWGGYLGWQNRDFKDFVDSRVDIFEYTGVLKDYLDFIGVKEPARVLDKYHIRYVLFPPTAPVAYALTHDPEWRVIFDGRVSVLLERAEPAPGDKSETGEKALKSPTPLALASPH
jgi:hypothetical protein